MGIIHTLSSPEATMPKRITGLFYKSPDEDQSQASFSSMTFMGIVGDVSSKLCGKSCNTSKSDKHVPSIAPGYSGAWHARLHGAARTLFPEHLALAD